MALLDCAIFSLPRDVESLAKPAINQSSISQSSLKAILLPVPSRQEQQPLAEFLDLATTKVDTLFEEQHRAIKLLQERRSALISAAVTGKIRVRSLSLKEIQEPA